MSETLILIKKFFFKFPQCFEIKTFSRIFFYSTRLRVSEYIIFAILALSDKMYDGFTKYKEILNTVINFVFYICICLRIFYGYGYIIVKKKIIMHSQFTYHFVT